MPKISLNQAMTVRPETIEAELHKIDTLLSGNLNCDNIGTYEDQTPIKLFPSMFNDFPSDTMNVRGMKFFGTVTTDESDPEYLFFNRLIHMLNNNKVFQTVQGVASFKLTNSNFEPESILYGESPNLKNELAIKQNGLKPLAANFDFTVKKPVGSNFKKTIIIEKPTSFVPIITVGNESNFFSEYAGNILHTLEFNVASAFTKLTSKPFDIYIGGIIDNIDSFEITVIVTCPTLDVEEYINVSVTVTVFCEDMP